MLNFKLSILNCGTSLIKERSYNNSTFKIQHSKLSFALGLPFVPLCLGGESFLPYLPVLPVSFPLVPWSLGGKSSRAV
jgi:hypothetical protein